MGKSIDYSNEINPSNIKLAENARIVLEALKKFKKLYPVETVEFRPNSYTIVTIRKDVFEEKGEAYFQKLFNKKPGI